LYVCYFILHCRIGILRLCILFLKLKKKIIRNLVLVSRRIDGTNKMIRRERIQKIVGTWKQEPFF
jgi:hypothetical protein